MGWYKITDMKTGKVVRDSRQGIIRDAIQKLKDKEMSNISQVLSPDTVERVILQGDLSRLSSAEKLDYYQKVVSSLGLNGLTKPFAFIKLNGKEVLYATRDCTDQLRRVHKISIKITSREHINGVYVVTAQASTPDGRVDESTGAVTTDKLSGDNLANAYLKCETKAKRRVTLSICGLGLLDETEVETIRDAKPVDQPTPGSVRIPIEGTIGVKEPRPAVSGTGIKDPDPENDPGEYAIEFGKKYKGQKVKDIDPEELSEFILWCEGAAAKKGLPLSLEAARLRSNFDAYIAGIAEKTPIDGQPLFDDIDDAKHIPWEK